MEKLSVEELEELREKEFDERAERDERIKSTISLFRKIACVLAVIIAAAFIFFHVRKDYNNYAGSQLVMAEVINVEGADDENINVTYQYNIASAVVRSSCETLPAGTSTSSRPYMASTAALHSSSLHTSCNARGRMRSNRGFTSG